MEPGKDGLLLHLIGALDSFFVRIDPSLLSRSETIGLINLLFLLIFMIIYTPY